MNIEERDLWVKNLNTKDTPERNNVSMALKILKSMCDVCGPGCSGCPFLRISKSNKSPGICQFREKRLTEIKMLPSAEPFKEDWEEFNIDPDTGYFTYKDKRYYYREDARFETENSNEFRGFGGWLYMGGAFWTTNIQFLCGCNYRDYVSDGATNETTPVLPAKIRFWRIRK